MALNILYVISDQHQARLMGVEGHRYVQTPHMDRLARSGVRFRHAYTQNPICTPSRVSILSGQYAHNHGYYGLCGPVPAPGTLPDFVSHFRQHNYRTGYIGNAHLPNDPRGWLVDSCDVYRPCNDHSDSRIGSAYNAYLADLGLLDKEDSQQLPEFPDSLMAHEGRASMLPFEHSVEAWCTREAISFMDGCGDKPFVCHLAYPRPHQCYTPAQEFWDMYPDDVPLPDMLQSDQSHRPPHFRAMIEQLKKHQWLIEPKTFEAGCRRVWHGYLGLISQTDHCLGMLLDYLARTGRDRNTIVIYNADHGAYTGTFGVREKAPGICSEQVCRVPYLWRVPGVTPTGYVCDELVENVDIAPTLASLCGVAQMKWVDGMDITALLRGDNRPLRDIAVTENVWSKSVRSGPWRLVHYQPQMFEGQDVGELYDLANDPMETRNLYHDCDYQAVVNDLRRKLLEWLIHTTRARTVWPGDPYGTIGDVERYVHAEDGREPNDAGPALRAHKGQVNYL